MSDVKERTAGHSRTRVGISLSELADRIGRRPAEEFFERMDRHARMGDVIVGTNVRTARADFSKAQAPGHAQLVVRGNARRGARGEVDLGEAVVVIRMDDFEAVVRAAQHDFSWAEEFAPRPGLPAAASSPVLTRGSRGRRQLRG